ncbi:hypothetical protein AJ79_05737 [Helicocarpus griseus UAMH5409]|uniref:Major facilitator superfamily (MFS) profile domain-containing protein n=1 Tax=Helicocarpus griseus UAMH5409 TaxID=1447875 RepID=A0A2B7XKR6_9EURO|nr:hypothetical protein AJ79_05737 [Helicocarpus griseus UAMH5409]
MESKIFQVDSKKDDIDVSENAKDTGSSDGGATEIYIDPVLEQKVMRKFDIFVIPQMVLLVILAYLDRSNIGNARVFGFEEGIGLQGTEFNNLTSLFFVTYVVFEIPWVMSIKKLGANRVLATAIVCWSVVTIGFGFVKNYHQALALRLLLGLFEAGLIPCLTFLISMIYTRQSQAKRVAALYAGSAISGAFGGLIAYGIQTMGDRHGLSAWRWLFIVEGIISLVIGGIAWLTMPKNAVNAWFLNEEEKGLMRARHQRDAIYKGVEEFSWSYVKMAFVDPFIYVASLGLFCSSVPLFGFGLFLPTIIKGLGYDSLQANYLTIPVYVLGTLSLYLCSWVSDKLNRRAIIGGTISLLVVIGYAISVGTANGGAGFFAMFLCAAGIYPYNAILLTWVSNNIKPDHKRSVSVPLFTSLANISGLISSQIYPSSDGPRYITGNSVSLAMEFVAVLCVWGIYFLLRRRNIIKEAMIAKGATDNGKQGDRALDFKYTL